MKGKGCLELRDGAVYLDVRVVPGASRTRLMGMMGDRLKIAVAAPPEKGKANAEVVRFVAERVGLRRRAVVIESGHGAPLKRLRLMTSDPERVRAALGI